MSSSSERSLLGIQHLPGVPFLADFTRHLESGTEMATESAERTKGANISGEDRALEAVLEMAKNLFRNVLWFELMF